MCEAAVGRWGLTRARRFTYHSNNCCSSIVHRAVARVVEPAGLSLAQYNALRIVRGAGPGGIPTLSIRDRMIEEGTTITRLLDKLEDGGLIRRERNFPDRRQVLCFITD